MEAVTSALSGLASDPAGTLEKLKVKATSTGDKMAATLEGIPMVGDQIKTVLVMAAEATSLPSGLILSGIAGVLMLIALLIIGLTNIVTMVAFSVPAIETIHTLKKPESEAKEVLEKTCMPLYWIVFSFMLMLEDILEVIPYCECPRSSASPPRRIGPHSMRCPLRPETCKFCKSNVAAQAL